MKFFRLCIRSICFFVLLLAVSNCGTEVKGPQLPQVITRNVSAITQVTASFSGAITNADETVIESRGVCWGTSSGPTLEISNKTSDGAGAGDFVSSLSGLIPNTTYYVRAYATNKFWTGYGNEISFTTLAADPPVLTTHDVTSITSTVAQSGGSITSDGYSEITARGVCWSTAAGPTIADIKTSDGTGVGDFISDMTNLSSATTYYVRAYAVNAAGVAYGNELNFTTDPGPVAIKTTFLGQSSRSPEASAGISGTITTDGSTEIIARGVCIGVGQNPTTAGKIIAEGAGTGTFSSQISGLAFSTRYYVRAYVITSGGTFYGNQVSFTTERRYIPPA